MAETAKPQNVMETINERIGESDGVLKALMSSISGFERFGIPTGMHAGEFLLSD